MFSINLKRSVATVGVVAGLLAAAAPASAQGGGAPSTSAWFIVPDHELSLLAVAPGESPQGTNASLGRENSIECLLRAEASDEGQTQSRKPAPLGITLCHEGFEIK